MNQEDKPTTEEEGVGLAVEEKQPEDNDFPLGKACDLSGEGTCDSCQ